MSGPENDVDCQPTSPSENDGARLDPELRRRSALFASAAAVLLAVVGIAVALGLGQGAQLVSPPEAAATTVRATPPAPRPQYTAQAPITPGQIRCSPSTLQRACSQAGSGAARASAATAWFNAAKSPFNTIQLALQAAGKEAQASNVDGVRSACEQLAAGSRQLGNTLPSPDEGLTNEVQAAVDELTVASDMCLAPDAASNYQAVMSHVTAANSHFAAAQQIIEGKS